jgi:hypothetical protein
MAVKLEIRDGNPHWWNSPDIWVVPGNDPDGAPGQPIAGVPAYLWGRVRNNGATTANGARVNFYWSNPATGVLRSNSTYVGSSFVDLDPGEVQAVLCLTPWVPTVVNDGHECVVAEVIHAEDPLPNPLPDPFDPPTYDQVAQRNLSVLTMTTSMLVVAIQVAAPPRKARRLQIMVQVGEKLDRQSLDQLGLGKVKLAPKPMVRAALSLRRECERIGEEGKHSGRYVTVDLEAGTSKAVYLCVDPEKLRPGLYTPLDVIARDEREQIVGGATFIATHTSQG